MSSTKASQSFEQTQKSGLMMVFGMATMLVIFAIVVATSLPVSDGLKLAPMDADEVAAQMASSDQN
ncbi:MAG: hypothetical protein AAFN74_11485 [Myxococcota bacterium]